MTQTGLSIARRLLGSDGPATKSRDAFVKHLHGEGFELGALCDPLDISHAGRVRSIKYVDRYGKGQLLKLFPELHGRKEEVVEADYLCDLTHGLTTFESSSVDFIVANHLIEHLPDPIGLLKEIWRVLKVGGICYLGVPDKRFTFDRDRPNTTLSHLRDDHRRKIRHVEDHHLEEFLRLCDRIPLPRDASALKRHLSRHRERSIHVHVWTFPAFVQFLMYVTVRYAPFAFIDVSAPANNPQREMIFILEKTTKRGVLRRAPACALPLARQLVA